MNTPVTSNLANAIRFLAVDAVQKANSGHPGAPMGMAEIAQALWTRHLRHNPKNPNWFDRDRFVLSNGHGSMLLYALLHLTGYDVSVDDLKNFRQLHSKTPGHPEVGITAGIETTTGPLGQGLGNAVGFALAEELLAAEFNRPEHKIVDHFTYAFVGDGCLMEGISHEVCSLAGTLKLSKLIVLYDDNGISIDGKVESWFADDTAKRFESYGWNVINGVNGHDVMAVDHAIAKAKQSAQRSSSGPTIIICKTVIGKGSPNKEGTDKVHGSPLGADEIAATRSALNWPYVPFEIPAEIYAGWNQDKRGAEVQTEWDKKFALYSLEFPELAADLTRRMNGDLPANFSAKAAEFLAQTNELAQTVATRKASQISLDALHTSLPEFLGGSADLTASNLTDWKGVEPVRAGANGIKFGRHINYGVREFGMSAIMNGIALHGGYLPFGGTFETFSDYSRNAIRMAALMKQRVIHVLTHDSIGLGEDGPTHQPIEHAASLRLIPNLDVWRPCDTLETAVAWISAIERPQSVGMNVKDGGPSALLLSRQNLPFVKRTSTDDVFKGGYILKDADNAKLILVSCGSEIEIALAAAEQLNAEGIATRVVSMPSSNVFDRQSQEWKDKVLPANVPCVAIEAGVTTGWYKYTGRNGAVIGIDRFGESAPAGELFKYFGLTTENVVKVAKQVL